MLLLLDLPEAARVEEHSQPAEVGGAGLRGVSLRVATSLAAEYRARVDESELGAGAKVPRPGWCSLSSGVPAGVTAYTAATGRNRLDKLVFESVVDPTPFPRPNPEPASNRPLWDRECFEQGCGMGSHFSSPQAVGARIQSVQLQVPEVRCESSAVPPL